MQRLDVEPGSIEWFEARCGKPTVSCFAEFITPARGDYSKSSIRYIARLIHESRVGPVQTYTSDAMLYGTATEPEAAAWYELDQDCETQSAGIIFNKGAGWSPDRLVGTKGGLEIKCPEEETHIIYLLGGELPTEYKPQCHGALIVGELDWLDFISYCPGYRSLVVRVVRSDYTIKVEAALGKFLTEYACAKAKILSV